MKVMKLVTLSYNPDFFASLIEPLMRLFPLCLKFSLSIEIWDKSGLSWPLPADRLPAMLDSRRCLKVETMMGALGKSTLRLL